MAASKASVKTYKSVLGMYRDLLRLCKFTYGDSKDGTFMRKMVQGLTRERKTETDPEKVKEYRDVGFQVLENSMLSAAKQLMPEEEKEMVSQASNDDPSDYHKDFNPRIIPQFRAMHDYTRPMQEETDDWKKIRDLVDARNKEYWEMRQRKVFEETKALKLRQKFRDEYFMKEDGLWKEDEPEINPGKSKRLERRSKARKKKSMMSEES
eukprot:243072_1